MRALETYFEVPVPKFTTFICDFIINDQLALPFFDFVAFVAAQAKPIIFIPRLAVIVHWNAKFQRAKKGSLRTFKAYIIVPLSTVRIAKPQKFRLYLLASIFRCNLISLITLKTCSRLDIPFSAIIIYGATVPLFIEEPSFRTFHAFPIIESLTTSINRRANLLQNAIAIEDFVPFKALLAQPHPSIELLALRVYLTANVVVVEEVPFRALDALFILRILRTAIIVEKSFKEVQVV